MKDNKAMNNSLKKLTELIDSLALDTVMLDPEDVPGLGEVLKSLESKDISSLLISLGSEAIESSAISSMPLKDMGMGTEESMQEPETTDAMDEERH